ncbi:hypothetical protein SORBI_3003G093200 [Sorghum bicolor]|uniref:Uncharacterized protein n=1 Tax=Sorghum bicolor TaxID=4558 RepID=A0A1B6Q282_SORBI|nr:hypothetical protein SORBI_3003G093200 [Sorghum bicolor]
MNPSSSTCFVNHGAGASRSPLPTYLRHASSFQATRSQAKLSCYLLFIFGWRSFVSAMTVFVCLFVCAAGVIGVLGRSWIR